MQKTQPINRLIEGDVGSGKTVVAVMAAVMTMKHGFQVAFMAPTELLARQHAETTLQLLEPLGLSNQVTLLVGGMSPKQKQQTQLKISTGDVRLIVGTHALLAEKVDMHKLGLVVIDEQHRFGVDQRKKLLRKAGHMPHVLSTTATPIPRSLALTVYGELDVSVLASKPSGRKEIVTKIAPFSERARVYEAVEAVLKSGQQAFVVCPLIEETELIASKSAETVYKELANGVFKHRRVGLLHGKLSSSDKESVMAEFAAGRLDVLVSTTVVEVGVDVPNAGVMVIEGAERFGLAQIHQLRGRVGRSSRRGYCYLVTGSSQTPPARLKFLERSNDGFKLAEYDLELRGPGAIYGTMQHGQLDLRIAKITDTKLVSAARARAQEFIEKSENLLEYKELYEHVQRNRSVTNLN